MSRQIDAAGARSTTTASPPVWARESAGEVDGKVPDCIEVKAVVRYGAVGYDHWVQLANRCQVAASCQVATNVNPKPQLVRVESGKTEEVLTFRGSPAREFEPRVACTLEGTPGGKRQTSQLVS